jgi:hypothetical protein
MKIFANRTIGWNTSERAVWWMRTASRLRFAQFGKSVT